MPVCQPLAISLLFVLSPDTSLCDVFIRPLTLMAFEVSFVCGDCGDSRKTDYKIQGRKILISC